MTKHPFLPVSCLIGTVGSLLLTLLSACVENPNSVGSLDAARGGSPSGLSSPEAGSGGKSQYSSSTSGQSSSNRGGAPSNSSDAINGSTYGGSSSSATTPNNTSASSEAVTAQASQAILQSTLQHDTSPVLSDADYQAYLGGINTLGFELFRRKAKASDENLVLSPVSLDVALSMAYGGAKGITASEMKAVLHDTLSSGAYHRAVNRLLLDLRSRNLAVASTDRPQSVELSFVDTWYLQRNFPVWTSYLDLLSTQYDAGVRLADFINDLPNAYLQINQFASDSTNGKITNLLREGDINGLTRAVLLNALYLNATWKNPFDTKETDNAEFAVSEATAAVVPTMHATSEMGYEQGDNFVAVNLPYVGDALSMLLILPNEGQFETVRSTLDTAWVAGIRDALTPKMVQLALPKFRITWGTSEFNQELIELGMPTAFDQAKADFTGITGSSPMDSLYIQKVLQKAFVGIDEAGTEAAAVSAVVLGWKSIPTVEATVAFNRPFLFAILDKTGAALFIGQVKDPR